MPSQASKARTRQFTAALRAHFRKAELIVYSSLLIVGGVQILIRERFPDVRPPWPLIGSALVVVLLGVVFVPPLLLLIRIRKKPDSEKRIPHS